MSLKMTLYNFETIFLLIQLLTVLHIMVEFSSKHLSASLYIQVPRNLPEAFKVLQNCRVTVIYRTHTKKPNKMDMSFSL